MLIVNLIVAKNEMNKTALKHILELMTKNSLIGW